jgi:hypothetical protein
MKSTELPALIELRESLREAAARDIAARKPRRRRRRGIAIFAAVLLGGAAAAGAADLISSGKPVNNENAAGARYNSSGQLQIAVKAHDTPLPWGVQIYTSTGGENCALVGRIRGFQLGRLDADGKTFHPYEEGHQGGCGDPNSKLGYWRDQARAPDRSVFYGRAKPGVKRVIFEVDGKRVPVETGLGGAFVIVFRGSVKAPEIVALD